LSVSPTTTRLAPTGDITGPHFDYVIWIALGLPMLFVLLLAMLAISGALTSR
jgi:hypothetical protein